MKKLLSIITVFLFYTSMVAAQRGTVKGSVTDTLNKQNLPNTIISVLKAKDSVLVKFTRSDKDGKFAIKDLPAGKFFLMVSYPAYADYVYPLNLADTSNEDVGIIKMTLKSRLLEEVLVRQKIAAVRLRGDYFKINIPGPGSKAGEGYDWVKVEDLHEVNRQDVDSIGLRVRPSTNPLSKDESIAHFYSEDSTSTFIVTREKNTVTATIYDRNAKPNTDAESIVDKIRHVATGIGAIFGGSKMQWKGLAKGLVKEQG